MSTNNDTKHESANAIAARAAVALHEAIHASGDKGIPSGHLYAQVMASVSLNTYETLIGFLKRVGAIEEKNHLLTSLREPPKL